MSRAGPLLDYIEKAELRIGDRIPPERELAQALSVPRSAVRAMLAELELTGGVWRHVGRGTFLGSKSAIVKSKSDPIDAALETFPAEVLETRLLLEPVIAGLAAQRATSSQISLIETAVARGNEATSLEDFETWDAAFHRHVVAAARNSLMVQLYRTIEQARTSIVWGRLKRASLTPRRRGRYESSHGAIARAISDRDSRAAERHMRQHLAEVRSNMLGDQT